jgi:hypothetical protein
MKGGKKLFFLFVMLVLSEGVSTNAWLDEPMGFAGGFSPSNPFF